MVDSHNHDPKTLVGVYASLATWMLGYPDRAARLADDNRAHARCLGHPFDQGWALSVVADLFDYRGEFEVLRKRTEETDRLGRENSLPFLWACVGASRNGFALIHEGKAAEGVETVKAALAIWDGVGGKVWSPYAKAVQAEGMAMLGNLDVALELLDDQIAQIERPGWEERWAYAEGS